MKYLLALKTKTTCSIGCEKNNKFIRECRGCSHFLHLARFSRPTENKIYESKLANIETRCAVR